MLRQDHRRGVHLHDDGRATQLVVGLQLRAVIDDGGNALAVHVARLLAHHRRLRIRTTVRQHMTGDLDALALHGRAHRDELMLERQREREQSLVLFVELVGDRLQAALLQILQIHGHRQAQSLAVVAEVHLIGRGDLALGDAFLLDGLRGLGRQLAQELFDFLRAGVRELAHEGLGALVAHRRRRIAHRT